MLASFTSMQLESQPSRFGNPSRFNPLGICSSVITKRRWNAGEIVCCYSVHRKKLWNLWKKMFTRRGLLFSEPLAYQQCKDGKAAEIT
jgi:hypothetical protein